MSNYITDDYMKNKSLIYQRIGNYAKIGLWQFFYFFKKLFTHNYCDTCGFTKDKVYVAEFYVEAGIIQCEKCSGRLTLADNVQGLCEGGLVGSSILAGCVCPLLPNPCYMKCRLIYDKNQLKR